MEELSKEKKVIFVVGPTASGKSSLALDLAMRTGGSIINCDSVQFYNHLFIGSAAPTEEDKKKVPHYLYSYVNPPEEMTAGRYVRDFYSLLKNSDIQFPLYVVGGTGFYIQALEKGMYNVPEIPSDLKKQIEEEINRYGAEKAYEELKKFDPNTVVHVNDRYRIGRALEVKRFFNLKMSEFQKNNELNLKNKLPYSSIKIGLQLDKEELFHKVNLRTLDMIERGLIQETENVLKLASVDWSPFSSVGYRETVMYLNHQISKQDLPEAINLSTRQLIKKQKTWFKRDPSIIWGDELLFERIQLFLKS